MKRLGLASAVLVGVCVAVVMSGVGGHRLKTYFPKEDRNPVTHLRWNEDADQFQFAIVSDRTGGHRADVFAQAVEKLNLMQPAFVLSVGDLIEGGKKPEDKLAAEWKEFDALVGKLSMPFFYVPGNHDVESQAGTKFWEGKMGRRHYHFVYRKVLFLILNSDDHAVTYGVFGKEQIAWAQKVLKDNAEAPWTIVIVHRPLWTQANGAKNGWAEVEKSLNGRNYTVFCGHVHRYQQWVRQGMNYYQLATTGGGSRLRGVDFGEFDHFTWVTMKKEGPVLANILVDAVHTENLQPIKTNEPGVATKRKPTHIVRGKAIFEGTPIPGAVVNFSGDAGDAKGITATGVVEGDGSFQLSTYKGFDGAPAGEYKVTVTWRESGKNLVPQRYALALTSGLRATVLVGGNEVILELKK